MLPGIHSKEISDPLRQIRVHAHKDTDHCNLGGFDEFFWAAVDVQE